MKEVPIHTDAWVSEPVGLSLILKEPEYRDFPKVEIEELYRFYETIGKLLVKRLGWNGTRTSLDPHGLLKFLESKKLSLQQATERINSNDESFCRVITQVAPSKYTGMFRMQCIEHYFALGKRVIPNLLDQGVDQIRMLFLGCSTGMDAYSSLMVSKWVLQERKREDVTCEAVAVDQSEAALNTLTRGFYPGFGFKNSWRAMELHMMPREFMDAQILDRIDPTGYEIVNDLKRQVFPYRRNLAVDDIPQRSGKFHVVFADGILMYLNQPDQFVRDKVLPCMESGGYLFTDEAGLIRDKTDLEQSGFSYFEFGKTDTLDSREPVISSLAICGK